MADITNIPAPRVDFIDPRTGFIAREWYLFLLNLFRLVGSGSNSTSLTDLQLAPTTAPFPFAPEDFQAILLRAPDLSAEIASLQRAVADLQSSPPVVIPHFDQRYGSFCDTTTQTAAAPNTAYAVTFNTTTYSRGIYIGSPSSRIVVDRPSVYNIDLSAQCQNTGGGAHVIDVWLRKNGVDITNTTRRIRVASGAAEALVSWGYLTEMNVGDYLEMMWATDNTAMRLYAEVPTSPHPGVPSVTFVASETNRT